MDVEPILGDAEDRDPQNNNDFIKVSIAFFFSPSRYLEVAT